MYDLMIAYHLVKINQIFSKNPPTSSHHPPNFLHQKAQVEVHHEISEPQSGFPEGMVKRSTGSTPMGLLVVGGSFSQKIKPGLVGRIGGIIYNYRIFWKQFGIRCFFLKQMHELHSLLLMCICFVFLMPLLLPRCFPDMITLYTLLPAPGHIPPFIRQVPMVTRAMMLRRCQCHRHHQRRFRQKQIRQRCGLGWKGIQETEGLGHYPPRN